MSARIARGSAGRSTPKKKAASRGSGRKYKKKQPGLLESLGVPPGAVRKVSFWMIAGIVVAVAVAAAVAFRVPQRVGTAVGEGIGDAGFAVRRVEIRGLDRMERLPVYSVALDQESMAMPLVDLEETRARLVRFGWIKEARVSRRLPDTLVVDIVEREPAAIWQRNRELSLIDSEGVVLEAVRLDAMPDLPLVIGPSANRHVPALDRLLGASAHMRPLVAGATWIGGRRWDLRFQTGEVLSLPEGEDAARRSIVTFARMDQQTQLLGRGFVRFDMRVPGKFVVRVSREPGTTIPAITPDEPAAVPEDLSRTI